MSPFPFAERHTFNERQRYGEPKKPTTDVVEILHRPYYDDFNENAISIKKFVDCKAEETGKGNPF